MDFPLQKILTTFLFRFFTNHIGWREFSLTNYTLLIDCLGAKCFFDIEFDVID